MEEYKVNPVAARAINAFMILHMDHVTWPVMFFCLGASFLEMERWNSYHLECKQNKCVSNGIYYLF